MKKILALALTLTLALALSVSVFAAPETHNVFGTNVGLTDGEFNSEKTYSDLISITVQAGQVHSRYAVDVEYEDFSIAVSGTILTWDVVNLKYVSSGDASTNPTTITKQITIINRSDKPVYATPAITSDAADDYINITASTTDELTVPAATVGDTPVNERTGKQTFSVTVSLEAEKTWNDVAAHYSDELSDGVVEIGTIGLSITKEPNP